MNNLFRWFTTNLRLFLLALALAMAVWVMAVTTSDPDRTGSLPELSAIEFIGQDSGLIITELSAQVVEITLQAPESVWEQIEADPGSVRAIVDLSGLDAASHQLTVEVQVAFSPVRIVSVSPAAIDLLLEPLSTISLPISLSIIGEPAIGYEVGDTSLTPDEVVVSGPESIVRQVDAVVASLDLSETRESVETSLPLGVFDEEGNMLSGLSLSPDSVQVSLPVTQLGGYRDLAVKVVTVGRVASGYRIASVAAFPPIVTVYSADSNLIASLPGFVETNSLDLSGASENIETRLGLILPSDVTLVGEQTVLVQVGITPIQDSLTVAYRPVVVTGLNPGLKVVVSPVTVDVILSGPIPALESLNASDVQVSVDATGYGAGTYQLTPVVSIPVDNVSVQSVLPSTVQVTITSTGTATPR